MTEDFDEITGTIPVFAKVVALTLLAALVGFIALVIVSFEPPDLGKAKLAQLELELEPGPGDDHTQMRFAWDVSAKTDFRMERPEVTEFNEFTPVVGIVVGNVAHAYVLKKAGLREFLLASIEINGKPIVLFHNYLTDASRVMTSEDSNEWIDIRAGGMCYDKSVVFLYNGLRYQQNSQNIGLSDYAFERTTLRKWCEAHPETLVSFDQEIEDEHFRPFD
ncbi:MAG: hypothetical protein KDB22_08825 [Planctomycetales bacterium]|nr:hypothetical protein [Planctomycetales bacterium]